MTFGEEKISQQRIHITRDGKTYSTIQKIKKDLIKVSMFLFRNLFRWIAVKMMDSGESTRKITKEMPEAFPISNYTQPDTRVIFHAGMGN